MNRTRKDLLESRLELTKLIVKGVPLKDAAAQIASKWPGVSVDSVCVDWQRRKKWLGDVVQVADDTFFSQAFFGLKELIPMAWLEFSRVPTGTAARNRALQTLIDIYCKLIEIMSDAGFAPRAPLQLETSQRLDLGEDDAIWNELSPEEKGQLVLATEIYARHRNARRNRSTIRQGPLN